MKAEDVEEVEEGLGWAEVRGGILSNGLGVLLFVPLVDRSAPNVTLWSFDLALFLGGLTWVSGVVEEKDSALDSRERVEALRLLAFEFIICEWNVLETEMFF